MSSPRDELRSALAQRTTAESALEQARSATDRARTLLESIVRDGEYLDASDLRAAEALADKLRDSIAAGETPTFAGDRQTEQMAPKRAALDARRRAAERVVAELVEVERQAEETLKRAKEAVASAVREVVRLDAQRLAEKWSQVDAEARSLRIRLGGGYGLISKVRGPAAEKAIHANDRDWAHDEGPVRAAVDTVWSDLAAALARNADALVDFSIVDQANEHLRAERAEKARKEAEWEAYALQDKAERHKEEHKAWERRFKETRGEPA